MESSALCVAPMRLIASHSLSWCETALSHIISEHQSAKCCLAKRLSLLLDGTIGSLTPGATALNSVRPGVSISQVLRAVDVECSMNGLSSQYERDLVVNRVCTATM